MSKALEITLKIHYLTSVQLMQYIVQMILVPRRHKLNWVMYICKLYMFAVISKSLNRLYKELTFQYMLDRTKKKTNTPFTDTSC